MKYPYTLHQRETKYQKTEKWCAREGIVTGDCVEKSNPSTSLGVCRGITDIYELGQCLSDEKVIAENSLGIDISIPRIRHMRPVCRTIWWCESI